METIKLVLTVLLPVLGASLASFWTAQIMRLERLTKADGSRSECDHCGKTLRPWELIPIVSYLMLRGRCAECGKRISLKLFFAEVVGFIGFLPFSALLLSLETAAIDTSVTVQLTIYLAFAFVFLYLAIYDLLTFTLPTRTVSAAVGVAILLNILILAMDLFNPVWEIRLNLGSVFNLLAAVVYAAGFALIVRLTKQTGMGIGDVYIAAVTGLILGWPSTLSAFYVTAFLGGVVAVGLLLLRRQKWRGTLVPLMPLLFLGFTVAATFGNLLYLQMFPGL